MRNVIKLTLIIFFLNICIAKSGIVKPKSKIAPAEVIKIYKDENKAVFKVVILDQNKKFFQFRWQVEKFLESGPLQNCWLTTVVSQPIPLGSST